MGLVIPTRNAAKANTAQVGIRLTQPATRSCGEAAHAAQPALPGEAVAE